MRKLIFSKISLLICMIIASIAFAACAGSQNGSSASTAIPTPTIIPTYNFVQPTEAPQIVTRSAETATAEAGLATAVTSLDPDKVAKGRDRYTALQCNTCHGDNGEGTDKGKALTTFAMSQDDFISFMRSGGSMGSAHQYATNKLSDSGGKNLYEYLKSLTGQ
jgi:mono/diheme cytochrome c family protein